MPVFELYPDCQHPTWMKKGAWCYCLGEANDKFTVEEVGKNAAVLLNSKGRIHGWESFTKLYRTISELEKSITENR